MNLIPSGTNDEQDQMAERINLVWSVDHDPQTGVHRFSGTQATVGSAGSASALPATPSGYLTATLSDGTAIVIPYYAAS